MIAKLSQQTFR